MAEPNSAEDTQVELTLLRSLRDAVEAELDIYTRAGVLAALAALRKHEKAVADLTAPAPPPRT